MDVADIYRVGAMYGDVGIKSAVSWQGFNTKDI